MLLDIRNIQVDGFDVQNQRYTFIVDPLLKKHFILTVWKKAGVNQTYKRQFRDLPIRSGHSSLIKSDVTLKISES